MKEAFTLAEVLISLTIIGVVAAITVPSLVNSYHDKMYRSALKKEFSVISNAFNLAKKYEYNDYEEWSHKDSNVESIYENYLYIKKYLYVLRDCKDKVGCWSQDLTKDASGKTISNATEKGIGNSLVTFTLNDGTNVCLDYYNQSDIKKSFGVEKNLLENPLAIWVDVNGDKRPNRSGRDVFSFVLTSKGVVPSGANNHSANCRTTGFDCSAKYIYTY